ncbi:MAG: phosphoribosylamine--glycine ligase [Cyclobacteriaceae bacterium]
MNILVIGAGGREHAIAWKIKQSELCDELFVSPGNGGTDQIATNLPYGVNDFEGIKSAVREHNIELLVVGPEEPLVKGLVDDIKGDEAFSDLLIVGASQEGAQLEGSKDYAKQFMNRHGIPTAKAKVFNKSNLEAGKQFLDSLDAPYVLKADGLAAGKGVIITEDLSEAKASLEELIGGKFGDASANVLIEEFLSGIELSVFALTDGESYVLLPEAKDYKRIGEGDTGLNTGGMGAISPVGFADNIFMEKVVDRVVKPTVEGIKKDGLDYKGFVFFGLISVKNEPFVIEYNVRMGDPETEVVMPRIKSDIVPVLIAAAKGELNKATIEFENFTASTVVMVSGGYPEAYEKGHEISVADDISGVLPFHAGTKKENGKLLSNGGRVIAVSALGKNMQEALNKSYAGVEKIQWKDANYRSDIGFDLKALGQ